jgi:PAS domain S-box-containing protein
MTIGRSFLLWLLGVLIATLVLVSALVLWHEHRVLSGELEKQSRLLARTLALAAAQGGAPEYLAVISTADLRSGEVRTRDGQILWRYGPPLSEAMALDLDLIRIDESVEAGAGPWGGSQPLDVILLVSPRRIDRLFAGSAVRLVTALGLVLALALVVGLGMVGRLVQPLGSLSEAVRSFNPDSPPKIDVSSTGISEVRELASAFEGMTRRLADQRRSLAASERRYRGLFAASPTPLLELDEGLAIRGANAAAAAFLGRGPGDAHGTSISRFVENLSADELASSLAAAYLADEAVVETRWRLSDDESAEVELHVRPAGDERSPVLLVAIHDVTDRVRRLGERWQRTFDEMVHGVALVGPAGEIAQANQAIQDHLPAIREGLAQRLGSADPGEWRITSHDRLLQCSLASPEGLGHSILVARDVTDAVRAETRLREAEKMQAVGTLASGVAHDFNNLLAAITLHVRWLLAEPDATPEAGAAIRDLAEEGVEVVRELLLFARRESTPPRTLDLVELIRSHEGVLRHLMPPEVELRLRLGRAAVPVIGNPVALRRMLLNLVVNGRDAVAADGGWVELALDCRDEEAVLQVRDNGPGVPAEFRDRLFEPFVSSRRRGRGAGLGLAVVYAIVTEHRGVIELDPRSETGACFTVRLPVGRASDIEPIQPPAPEDRDAALPRVLLVDSDGRNASRIIEALADSGLDVRHAPDLASAESLVVRWSPDAVVADSRLPDGDLSLSLGSWDLPAVVLAEPADDLPATASLARLDRDAFPERILAALQRLGVPVISKT